MPSNKKQPDCYNPHPKRTFTMRHTHGHIALTLCILHLALCVLTSCEPDKTCRQEIDIQCHLLAEDSTSVTLYRAQTPLRVDTTLTEIPILCPQDSSTCVLSIHHDNTVRFISMACGCMVTHTIDSVWTSDPTRVKAYRRNDAVTSANEDNILLVFQYRKE